MTAPAADGSERSGALVPSGEEYEPNGTGGRESELLHSTEEVGEPSPKGPSGGKAAAGSMEPGEGKTCGRYSPGNVSTRLHRIAELARQSAETVISEDSSPGGCATQRSEAMFLRSRMGEFLMYGSVGGLGG